MITEKQKKILQFAYNNENKVTSKNALELIGNDYYCNSEKYVSEVLSRMVKSGLLKRVKKGSFEILKKQTVYNISNPNQFNLL